jgi:D-amino-acid dehydrogenase
MVDEEHGYVLAPMIRGIRLTSGAQFATLDAPPQPVQIAKAEPYARQLFPLGQTVDDKPSLGARPVFPDMRPVIGRISPLPNCWGNFGHGHQGLTLGPATGLLLAQMMTGAEPYCDPEPFSAARFGTLPRTH